MSNAFCQTGAKGNTIKVSSPTTTRKKNGTKGESTLTIRHAAAYQHTTCKERKLGAAN
jgi:hypothetical protein